MYHKATNFPSDSHLGQHSYKWSHFNTCVQGYMRMACPFFVVVFLWVKWLRHMVLDFKKLVMISFCFALSLNFMFPWKSIFLQIKWTELFKKGKRKQKGNLSPVFWSNCPCPATPEKNLELCLRDSLITAVTSSLPCFLWPYFSNFTSDIGRFFSCHIVIKQS